MSEKPNALMSDAFWETQLAKSVPDYSFAPSPSPVVEVTVTAEMVTEALSAFYTPRPWPARTKAEKRGAMRHALIAALSAR